MHDICSQNADCIALLQLLAVNVVLHQPLVDTACLWHVSNAHVCASQYDKMQSVYYCLQGEMLYRFARCKQPLAMRVMYNCGLPLPEYHVDVMEPRLRWEQFKVWDLLFPSPPPHLSLAWTELH